MPQEHDPGEDVRLVLSETGEWIRNADTKTGLLATVLAVLLGVISQKAEKKDLFPPFSEGWGYVPFAFLVLTVTAIAASYWSFYRVLSPRVDIPSMSTRFAWPWIAYVSESALGNLDARSVRKEAWVQARALALISQAKFKFFRRGLATSAISGCAFLIWLFLVSVK
ncbi:hypothetical protein [Streptomyces rubiginosohelvolus]|uniref:Pycsar effector protein domain-containing protein n=1 Tax=Streptomyces rubiginosohelvolus TaxID=67362 RepID=A0ABQ3CEJ8_9ACTN|nr:hypothetical protein [Streptomyces pluricolorescens]GGZ78907.1 hypothetical protein GCM10010328_62190 [Streptomyces pluricolorescens]